MKLTAEQAAFEYIITGADETFLWRKDDYPWVRNVWNFHPEIEIHLITNASGIQLIGDHIGEFRPGELTVVGSNLPHDWVTPVQPGELIEGRDIVIQFHPDKLHDAARIMPELGNCSDFIKRAERGLNFHSATRERATEIIWEMETLSGVAKLAAFLQLIDVLQKSDEYTVLSSRTFSPDLEYGSLDMLRKVLAYILANLHKDISLPDAAALTGMSESAFSRFFKKNSGHTFTDHVNKLRIWKASQLLADTDMPITEICFEVGYLNISNFNRTFLRHHKMTPSSYRKLATHRRLTPIV